MFEMAGTVAGPFGVGDPIDISDIHDRYSGPNGEQLSDLELLQKVCTTKQGTCFKAHTISCVADMQLNHS